MVKSLLYENKILVEKSLFGCYLVNDMKFSYVNSMFEDIFGYSSSELCGNMSIMDLIHPDDFDIFMEKVNKRNVENMEDDEYKIKCVTKDRVPIFVKISAHSTIDDKGRKTLHGTIKDVTEQEILNQKLLKATEELESMVKIRTNDLISKKAELELEAQKRTQIEEQIAKHANEILNMSIPMIKIWDNLMLVPLIGVFDSQRAAILMETLLDAIVENSCDIVVIDVTGIPTIDTKTAQCMLDTVMAVKLLGGKTILTGIRPEIAQTIVHLGVDLKNMTICTTLSDALKKAFAINGLQIKG